MTNADRDRSTATVLGPTVAGTWYPSDAAVLARQIDGLIASADRIPAPTSDRVLRGLIAPHAGLVYSGSVAACGFRSLDTRSIRRVLAVGPSHYSGFRGIRLPRATAYRTPLGEVPLDHDAIGELSTKPRFDIDSEPFEREHCLEAEIPFLQQLLPQGWSLVPMLIGASTTVEDRAAIAGALRPLIDSGTALIVSSDFTHYGSAFRYVPFRTNVREKIRALDMGAVERIVARDRRAFNDYVAETGVTICGRTAIDVLLAVLPDVTDARLIAYDTSGNLTGDWTHSVSYASIAFWW